MLFGGNLAYPIKVDKDDDISGGIIWELKNYRKNPAEGRLLEYTMTKHSPIASKCSVFEHDVI